MAMTDWDDLDQFLGDVPDEDFERPDALDADKANRMLRKLRRLERWKQGTEATANAEITRVAEWRDGRTRMISGEIRRLEDALEGYMRALNRVDPKVKTHNLPNGSLRLRAPRTRVVIDAPELAINFLLHRVAENHPFHFADVDKVLDALEAEPLLRLKVEVAGGEVGKTADKGMSLGLQAGPLGDSPASNIYSAVLPDGQVLPGVALHAFVDDTFTLTLADDANDDPQDGGPVEDEL